ncbi:MAG: efflux RND transporter periplasmic adaptor subunit, partial [Bacteroidia bacterium]|nr:efflux RND transporter periplasmic adaptor subunit [Bacteroidia bacterium]
MIKKISFAAIRTGMFSFLIFFAVACGKKDKTAKAEYKDLTEAVYASGNIFPVNEYKVFANADGFLTALSVSEGDSVKDGQLLFTVASEMQDAKARSSSEIYKIAVENSGKNSPALNEAESQLNSSLARLQNDSLNYARMKNLIDSKSVSLAEFEKSKLNYQVSQNDYKAKKNFYEKLKNQFYVELQNAEAQMRVSGTDADNYRIKSIMNGKVFEIYRKRGESIRRNEPVALIGDEKNVYLKLGVDETDISKIQTGQEVLVKIDVMKGKIYKAKVSKIYPKLNKEDQSFRVDAVFAETPPTQFYGLTVEANIITGKRPHVLTVPLVALVKQDSLYLVTDGEK